MIVNVRVSALLFPTEIQEKVERAILNLFPVELTVQDFGTQRLYGEGNLESMRIFHRKLREGRILDAARNILLEGIDGNTTCFRLNKQVALTGKLNFPPDEESLGSINVEISTESKEHLAVIIDWLAPRTMEGKPVIEIDLLCEAR